MSYHLFNDRRKCFRRPKKTPVLLKLGELIKGHGHMKDIGTRGICITSAAPFAYYRPEQSHVLLEKTMQVTIPEESLTLQGTIVRFDVSRNELAMVITHTSSNAKWKSLSR